MVSCPSKNLRLIKKYFLVSSVSYVLHVSGKSRVCTGLRTRFQKRKFPCEAPLVLRKNLTITHYASHKTNVFDIFCRRSGNLRCLSYFQKFTFLKKIFPRKFRLVRFARFGQESRLHRAKNSFPKKEIPLPSAPRTYKNFGKYGLRIVRNRRF